MIPPRITTVMPYPSAQDNVYTSTEDHIQTMASNLFEQDPSSPAIPDIQAWIPQDCTALVHAFVASFSVIIISELGDKTFIITAIMAMKNTRLLVFLASALALLVMTIMSVVLGVAVTVIPKTYTHYASIVLFICFGLKMLKEAYDMVDEENEFDEVERSLKEDEEAGPDTRTQVDKPHKSIKEEVEPSDTTPETAQKTESGKSLLKTLYVAPIVVKVFTMIFVAEWGDRSQISTVILSARENVYGVFLGSFVGHLICTGLAVIGGRFVADMISVRTLTFVGGLIFLLFATFAIISGPE